MQEQGGEGKGERMREGDEEERKRGRRGEAEETYSTSPYHPAQVPNLWIKEEP